MHRINRVLLFRLASRSRCSKSTSASSSIRAYTAGPASQDAAVAASSSGAGSVLDLRSDTVTKPSPKMLEAMRNAEVGDDVYMEDKTVIDLETRMKEMCKMEAAMFVPSGTMGNLIAVGLHCTRGSEVLLGKSSHIYYHEGGGASSYFGVSYHTIPNQSDGTLSVADLTDALRPTNIHYPTTSLVCIENTHNGSGGKVLTPAYMHQVATFCKTAKLPLHVDGARLFNAAVAQNTPLHGLLEGVASVNICISKGLGCPVGSVLVGSSEFINRARRLRKSLGGGMRQAGVLAAAGLYALDHNVNRLIVDHANARLLATKLAEMDYIDVTFPDTNIVKFGFRTSAVTGSGKPIRAADVVEKLKTDHGVLMNTAVANQIRAVTHIDVTGEQIVRSVDAIHSVIKAL
jgi:threonine aldolase